MRKLLLLGLLVGIFIFPTLAQELNFSQFFNTKLYNNPADAAAFEGHDAFLSYRSQWQGLADPFTSMQFSTSHAILRDEDPYQHIGGYGLEVHNFNAGPGNISTFGASINSAYNLYLNPIKVTKLTFGLKLGYEQKTLGTSDLTWGTQYNPNIGFDPSRLSNEEGISENTGIFTVGSGLALSFNERSVFDISRSSFHIKVAAMNMNQPVYSFYGTSDKANMFFTSEIGYHYLLKPRVLFGTNILFLKQGDNQLFNSGVNLSYVINQSPNSSIMPAWVRVGTYYRIDNSIVGMFGFGNGKYRLMFSYDVGANSLSDVANGGYNAYEISLGFKFIKEKHQDENSYHNTHDPRI